MLILTSDTATTTPFVSEPGLGTEISSWVSVFGFWHGRTEPAAKK